MAEDTNTTVVRPYQYSVSLDCTAKGYIQPSVKILSDKLVYPITGTGIETIAVLLLDRLVKELKHSAYKVATDIEDVTKNGKD